MKKNYPYKFIEDRKRLRAKYPEWNSIVIDNSNGIPIIEVNNSQLLAGFAGYLKFQFRNKAKIYCRGEKHFFRTTVPSLFRDDENSVINDDRIRTRKKAFDKLVSEIPTLFKSYRFKREDIAPLIQHYGIKTDWLDLLDNLFVALWFANKGSNDEYSYIKFIADRNDEDQLMVSDLREKHSSLSLRPHCQHGISVTRNVQGWNLSNIDFSDYLISIAKIRNESFTLSGNFFDKDYMFPNYKLDNTLKLLGGDKFKRKLEEITTEFNLKPNELGNVEW